MGRDHLADDLHVGERAPLRHRVALQAPPFLGITVVWVALWGDLTLANVVGGAAVAGLVVTLFHPGRRERLGRVRPAAAARFAGFVAVNLVRSTAQVAWEVITPTDRTRPGVLAVPLPSATPVVLTVVTAAIGLTPGTLVLDVGRDPTVVYVHVLHVRDVEDTRGAIAHLEALALAAFGPADAGDDVAALDALGGAP